MHYAKLQEGIASAITAALLNVSWSCFWSHQRIRLIRNNILLGIQTHASTLMAISDFIVDSYIPSPPILPHRSGFPADTLSFTGFYPSHSVPSKQHAQPFRVCAGLNREDYHRGETLDRFTRWQIFR